VRGAVAGALFLPERVGDPPHGTGVIHHDHVEPGAPLSPLRVLAKHDLGRAKQPCPLARRKGGGGLGQRRPRFHLDERKHSLLLGNDIDLAGGGPHPPRAHHPAIGLQRGGSTRLRPDAARRGLAAEPASRFFLRIGHPLVIPSSRPLPPTMAERLIVALDLPDIRAAEAMADSLAGVVSFFKIGLWLAFARGVDGLIERLIAGGNRVFLDAKLHDIGETVAAGVARAAERGVSFLTVHGEPEVMRAAVRGRGAAPMRILAVTVLTSLGDADLATMGYRLTARELVALRARQAVECGVDGIIASAADNPDTLRRAAGSSDLLVVTPGIRPVGSATDDHRRSATPAAAIASGADYLVVGRPITGAPDPRASAARIVGEMEQARGSAPDLFR
jgi:orotidine-5'-phosphate decarboxylase